MQLDRQRCQSLIDELALVADRLNDALAVRAAQMVAHDVAIRIRRPT